MNDEPHHGTATCADTATLPASCGQERLWFLHERDAGRMAYNVPVAFDVSGPLDLAALRESCLDVVRRHEVLRTTFLFEHGELLQVIHDEATSPFEVVDLSDIPDRERETRMAEISRSLVRQPFDLARGPLARFFVLRFDDRRHRFLLNVHHIVFDGWSVGILLRELAAFYRARLSGEPASLDPLRLQYGDFAAWQREWLKGAACREQLAFWKDQLRELPEHLALPTDHPGALDDGADGADLVFALPADLGPALQAFCRREGITLFMALLAGFQALLHRYTGQEQLLVGTPVANRSRVEVEGLIGFFVNTVVLRGDLSGNPTFRELLSRVREAALGAFDHADLPFEKVVGQLPPERRNSPSPLFRTMLVLQDQSPALPEFPGLQLRRRTVELGAAKFDLLLEFTADGPALNGCVSYRADLFERGTIERLTGHLTTLLRGLVETPDQPISTLPLIAGEERQQLLAWSRGKRTAYPSEQTLHAVFMQRVAETPDALALVEGDVRLSYAALDQHANRWANHLRGQGFGEDDTIGLFADRYWPFFAAAIGILKIGAAYVPIDPRDPPSRIAAFRRQISGVIEEKLDVSHESAAPPPPAGRPGGAAYVMFTSGSTGEPKGVVVPHQGVTRLVCATDYVQLDRDTVMMQGSNLCFDASTFEIWGALLHGGTLVVTRSNTVLDHAALAAHIAAHGINHLFLTTSLFNQHALHAPGMFRDLRGVAFGGEAADPAMVQRVLDHGKPTSLVNGYGPTETTTFAICHRVEEVTDGRVPIGRPIANTDAFLLDAHLQLVPPGVTGEIYVGGPGVALGYHRRPELTAERFVKTEFGRLYRTGDFGRWLADGTIEYRGRIDQQFKLRGFRIEPGEIEAHLRKHPAVAQCAVLPRLNPSGEKILVAYLVRRAGEAAVADAGFRQFLAENLARTFIPYAWFWLDALPLTANGKLDHRALPEPGAPPEAPRSYAPPQNSLQTHLVEIWEEVFNRRPIGIRDDFFALGGHSLLTARVIALIAERLGYRLPFAEFFNAPTIEDHARVLLSGQLAADQVPYALINPSGTRTPVFFFHGDFVGGGFFCKTLASVIGPDRRFYAFHPHGLQLDDVPPNIEAMAADRVRLIREIQPRGPYIVGGYCNGALTAFHAARLLRAAGAQVSVLLMVYANASNLRFRWLKSACGMSSALRGEGDMAAQQRFLRMRHRYRDHEDMGRYYLRAAADLLRQPGSVQAQRIWRKMRRIFRHITPLPAAPSAHSANGKATNPMSLATPRGPLAKPYGDACRAFIPEAYDSPVVLLWPKEEPPWSSRGPAAGWDRICPRLRVVEVPGQHHSCIAQNSNVTLLGEAMKRAIAEAENVQKTTAS